MTSHKQNAGTYNFLKIIIGDIILFVCKTSVLGTNQKRLFEAFLIVNNICTVVKHYNQ